jgi:hypothetical protein
MYIKQLYAVFNVHLNSEFFIVVILMLFLESVSAHGSKYQYHGISYPLISFIYYAALIYCFSIFNRYLMLSYGWIHQTQSAWS